ncbi:Protein of unknown function (DUF3089) [Nocardia amikacinitolerans]|uniref:DUF3089 domain-containing protein n=1 Tax=Nocardia amikacinitolerans TaxID=756689 RepID=UPI0008333905|nr:DUF3089 domain-containing protein [Nocardia amikacinitolerans]MCP2314944.1 Protein of unknown function (DUF3089) [Nocardia amikacinitolerans]
MAAIRRFAATLAAMFCAVAADPVAAQPVSTIEWLCSPALSADPCDVPLDTTDQLTGAVTTPSVGPEQDKPVDCFYVYPTVTNGPAIYADPPFEPAVASMATMQAARFSTQCRVFAPLYRQLTTPPGISLQLLTGLPLIQRSYDDLLAAWDRYLAEDNDGRGFLLIGHSQGSLLLRKLIRERIDHDPQLRERLVGAFLLGGNVQAARGSVVGGDFANIPLCTTRGEFGCVVAYSTAMLDPLLVLSIYGNSALDPLSAMVGAPSGPAYEVACTDPAVLSGDPSPVGLTVPSAPYAAGITALIYEYMTFPGGMPESASTWTTSAQRMQGRCETQHGYHFYRYRPTGTGDLHINELPYAASHYLDINLGYDRLVDIAAQQARGWAARR